MTDKICLFAASESLMSGSYAGNEDEHYNSGQQKKVPVTPPSRQFQLLSSNFYISIDEINTLIIQFTLI